MSLRHSVGFWWCQRFGHAELRWYTAKQPGDGAPVQLQGCPRCRTVIDVKRQGVSRSQRRKAWRKDWKQIKK